jgi:hypothetical protein
VSYVGAESAMIDIWVENQLKVVHAALFEAIDVGLSQRVYPDMAPQGIEYPFIVFQQQVTPEVVRGVGSAEVMVDTIYIVKAIAQGTTDGPLAPVASAIHDALVSNNGEAIIGGIGTIFTCHYKSQFKLTTAEQGSQFRHLGGAYRIQAQAVA